MRKTCLGLLLAALCARPCGAEPAAADLFAGIPSRYSAALASAARQWPPRELRELRDSFGKDSERGAFVCFLTPGNDLYIGTAQYHRIAAPYERTVAVLDDIPGHAGITSDLLVSRVDASEPGLMVVYSEQHIGIPLVRNERDQVIFRTSESRSPRRKFYLYQLKNSVHLKFNDGLIVLEDAGPGATDYFKYTFFDARWGLARAFSHDRIWRGSLRGIVQAALAIRLRAEHPDWSDGRVLKESQELARSFDPGACLRERRPWTPPAQPAGETAEKRSPYD